MSDAYAAEVQIAALRAALIDMRAGWQYIRKNHGDLYGVGWDRCEEQASAALAYDDPTGDRRAKLEALRAVSVEILNTERAVSDRLREENAALRAERDRRERFVWLRSALDDTRERH